MKQIIEERTLQSTFAYNIDYNELKNLIQSGEKVIAYVDTDHYVVIKKIDDYDMVTLLEDNSPITIDKNYFLEKWNGIVLAFTKPSTGVELTAEEAKAIRGAGMLTESLIGEAAPYNLYYGVGSPYPTGATLRIDYYGSTETLTEERYYGQKKDELDNFYEST